MIDLGPDQAGLIRNARDSAVQWTQLREPLLAALEFVGREGIEAFLSTSRGSACKKSPFLFAFGFAGRLSLGINKAWEESDAYLREHHPEVFEELRNA